MKMSRLFSIAALACACVLAAASSFVQHVGDVVVSTLRAAKYLVLDGFVLAAHKNESKRKPAVWFVQAKAFVLRLAKRQRPEVSGSWRMCPST